MRKKAGEQAKSKAKGFGKVEPSPVRREPTFLDKLVLKQPPPADVATAVQYDGASFVRQSAPVAPPKVAKPKAVIKPRSRGAGAKASIQKCIAQARARREQREAEAAAAGKADEPAMAGEVVEAGEADEVQVMGETSWAEKDAELREAAVQCPP